MSEVKIQKGAEGRVAFTAQHRAPAQACQASLHCTGVRREAAEPCFRHFKSSGWVLVGTWVDACYFVAAISFQQCREKRQHTCRFTDCIHHSQEIFTQFIGALRKSLFHCKYDQSIHTVSFAVVLPFCVLSQINRYIPQLDHSMNVCQYDQTFLSKAREHNGSCLHH